MDMDFPQIKLEDLDKLSNVDFWVLWGLMGKIVRQRHPFQPVLMPAYQDSIPNFEALANARMG